MIELQAFLVSLGVDLPRLLLGWARVMPVLVIVPAFGLSALPAGARGVMALSLAWICAPLAAATGRAGGAAMPHLGSVALELTLGTAIALVAAVPLWTATMVGNIADQWRGASESSTSPFEIGSSASLGSLATLFCAWAFFASGGAAQIFGALAVARVEEARDLTRALSEAPRVAVGIALPVIATGCVVDIGGGFMARSAPLAPLSTLIGATKAMAVVMSFAFVLPTMFELVSATLRQ